MKFKSFDEHVRSSAKRLSGVPWDYLNEVGRSKRSFYADLVFILDFCDSFADLEENTEGTGLLNEFQTAQLHKWVKEEKGE